MNGSRRTVCTAPPRRLMDTPMRAENKRLLKCYWPVVIVALTMACGGSGTTTLNGPTPAKCSISVTNSLAEIPAAGGSGSLTLDTTRECTWSSSAKDSWITLNAATGQGAATLGYTVLPNPTGFRRLGRVTVSDQSVGIPQAAAPCQYSVSPSAADMSTGWTTFP